MTKHFPTLSHPLLAWTVCFLSNSKATLSHRSKSQAGPVEFYYGLLWSLIGYDIYSDGLL